MSPLESAARNQEAWSAERERYRSITGAEHLRSRPPRHIRVTRMGRAIVPWLIAGGLIALVSLAIVGACAMVDRWNDGYTVRAVQEMRR